MIAAAKNPCAARPHWPMRASSLRDRLAALEEVAARYAVAITPAVADLIDPSDPHDPIARQFVPDARELQPEPEESDDPIGDEAFSPVEGIVHRYPDRVLLKLVNACAVYCRFCFRREMVGPGRGGLSPAALAQALDYIRATSANLGSHSDRRRSAGAFGAPAERRDDASLRRSPTSKCLRIHTRVPVAAPERVSAALVRALRVNKKASFRRAACQSSARTEQKGARGLRALDRCRHSDAVADGAVARRERRCRDARRVDAGAGRVPDQTLLPAPRRSGARHRAFAHHDRGRPGVDAGRCTAATRACASRPTCSTFRAATASRRSGRIIFRPTVPWCEDFMGRMHRYPPQR